MNTDENKRIERSLIKTGQRNYFHELECFYLC